MRVAVHKTIPTARPMRSSGRLLTRRTGADRLTAP
jgi:hypothetical protein